ncbi:MAG: UxaA family hydrolase, partial [Hyphomicrobiaceae bacterium]
MQDTPKAPRSLRLNAKDNLVVAVDTIEAGRAVENVVASARIPRGHKMATVKIAKSEPVLKFGQIIGFATDDILPGAHIHTHNCGFAAFERDYAFAQDARQEIILPVSQQATFEGFRRQSGKVGTRNYLGVVTSVNCSATVARFIAEAVNKSGVLADYPTIDGVIPLVHSTGCGIDS